MTYSFSKKERLQKGDFRGVRWKNRSETDHFTLLVHANKEGERKIGITIRKRVGSAVVRNRVRRMVREFYRLNKNLFPDRLSYLLKVKQVPEKLTWTETEKELYQLLHVKHS